MKNQTKKISETNYINIKSCIRFIVIFILLVSILSSTLYAEDVIDKMGRVVYETLKPTAESTIDEDTISSAVRFVPREGVDYTNKKYEGPSKNIFSKDTIYTSLDDIDLKNEEYTIIRNTPSITDVDEGRYELINDYKKNRMRLNIIIDSVGKFEAKNGFYKINEKIYYFDEEGLMVLGKAYDTVGNYYFFSYDTGELIEEKLIR